MSLDPGLAGNVISLGKNNASADRAMVECRADGLEAPRGHGNALRGLAALGPPERQGQATAAATGGVHHYGSFTKARSGASQLCHFDQRGPAAAEQEVRTAMGTRLTAELHGAIERSMEKLASL